MAPSSDTDSSDTDHDSARTKAAAKAERLAAKLAEKQAKVADRVAVGPHRLAKLLTVGEGFRLTNVDPRSTPGFDGKKADGAAALADGVGELDALQERLWAQSRAGDQRSLLLVV